MCIFCFHRVNEKEATDEFPKDPTIKSNNHRGSCASTLNLTDEPSSYEESPVFDDSPSNHGNALRAPQQHKSSKGHPYESKNTSF